MEYSRIDYQFFDDDQISKVLLTFRNGFQFVIPMEVLQEVLMRYMQYAQGEKYEQDQTTDDKVDKVIKALDGIIYNTEEDF